MIRIYRKGQGACEDADTCAPGWRLADDVIWLDLIAPTRDEEMAAEKVLGLALPTREEMAELEATSRAYRSGGATYAIADIIQHGDADIPEVHPVTFVLTSGPLVTIRYFEPRPFATVFERLEHEPGLCASGADLFVMLMEAIVDRLSDVLSRNGARVETIAQHVFSEGKTIGFDKLITKLGRAQIATARIEQSLSGLSRVFAFVAPDEVFTRARDSSDHLDALGRDVRSLISHAQTISAGINFQLSAALGLINIQQSSIIKIFSVASVAFLPPTLIASIYGMNFDHMPELAQRWGYPLAIAAMVLSAVLPLAYFKRRGWL